MDCPLPRAISSRESTSLDPTVVTRFRRGGRRTSSAGTAIGVVGALCLVLSGVAGCSDGSRGNSSGGSGEFAPLAPPAASDGIQLRIVNSEIPVGSEHEVCQLFVLDNDEPLEIGGFEIKQPLGSHHFVVYSYDGKDAQLYPQGQFEAPGCTGVGPPDSMKLTQVAGAGDDYEKITYPTGTGIRLRPHHPILLNSHFVNVTDAPVTPEVRVNLYFAKSKIDKTLEAAAIANYNIFVPPGKVATTTARWTVPFDLYFILLSSHEHKRGLKFTARIAQGTVDRPEGDKVGRTYQDDVAPPGSTPESGDFYRSEDWEHPTVVTYEEPRLFRAGTVVEFSCTQQNEKKTPVTFGTRAEDEMCFLTGMYYRAESAPPIGAVIPGCLPAETQLTCSADPVSSGSEPGRVCGDGFKSREEQCDRGEGNGGGGCADGCRLDLPSGIALGKREFPIVFNGPSGGTTEFLNSIIGGSSIDPQLGVVSDGPLVFEAGVPDASGVARVAQTAETRFGVGVLGGSGSFCARLLPTENAGTVACVGGVGVNITASLDNASASAAATDAKVEIGQGGDSGAGAVGLLLRAAVLQIAGTPEECLTRDWSADPIYPIPFTTGVTTGRITSANGDPTRTVTMTREGENFDCSRWTELDSPGVLLAMPFLAPNGAPGFGDVIAQLALAGRLPPVDDDPTPEPTATPVPGGIGGELLGIRDQIFTTRCGQPSCHNSVTHAGGLSLVGDDLHEQLVGHEASNPAAAAAGLLRVAAGDADASFLIRKLTGALDAGQGSRMPFGGVEIPAADLARIRAWVESGAPAR